MKLYEVLTKQHPNTRVSQKALPRDRSPLNPNWRKVSRGTQSDVYDPTNQPLDSGKWVTKMTNISGVEDANYQFFRMCANHQDNPYFPKIKGLRVYPLKFGQSQKVINKYKMVVTIERLKPFVRPDLKRFEELMGYSFELFDFEIESSAWQQGFENAKFRADLQKTVVDPKLKQALRLMEPLFKHYQQDMHFGNIMTRQNGDIVFIDPVL